MWTLQEGVELVQALEPAVRALGYHTCLAGGVLHKGRSEKDLDLVFLRLQTGEGSTRSIEHLLVKQFGPIEPFFGETEQSADYAENTHPYASVMGKIDWNGKRIDVFIQ